MSAQQMNCGSGLRPRSSASETPPTRTFGRCCLVKLNRKRRLGFVAVLSRKRWLRNVVYLSLVGCYVMKKRRGAPPGCLPELLVCRRALVGAKARRWPLCRFRSLEVGLLVATVLGAASIIGRGPIGNGGTYATSPSESAVNGSHPSTSRGTISTKKGKRSREFFAWNGWILE